jgi:pyruvate formate lyase activating enzyme
MTVDEVVSVAERDGLFYRNSGGGVTVSGGEPTLQVDFVEALMKKLKSKGLHVALDTCGEAPWEDLERLVKHADLVLYDLKHMDNEEHRRGTGTGNERVLVNAVKASQAPELWMRVPVMGGYNDSPEQIAEIAALAKRVGAKKVSLLPFHRWGEAKFEQLGFRYDWQREEPAPERVEELRAIIQETGLKAGIGS